MRLSILHMSDLHIHDSSDWILQKAEDIASNCYLSARNSEAFFIVITGDITYDAGTAQFCAAGNFISTIKSFISKEFSGFVDVFMVPGNHDARLKPENKSRTLVIDRIIADPEHASDESVIELCTSVQDQFFQFQDEITITVPSFRHKLVNEYELVVGGRVIKISAINASWMSRIPEEQGRMVFPNAILAPVLAEPADLRITLLHHPLNWYSQSSYHPLRQMLRSHSDIVMTGHEHISVSGVMEDGNGVNVVIEAPALQPHDTDEEPGFTVIDLDVDSCELITTPYKFEKRGAIVGGKPAKRNMRKDFLEGVRELDITNEFKSILRDPGGNFRHPTKDVIEIDDVYVYPELSERKSDDPRVSPLSADSIFSSPNNEMRVIFYGDDKSGKTNMLLRAFKELHNAQIAPVYIKAQEIKSVSKDGLGKLIEGATVKQYKNPDLVRNLPKSRRCVLLDDVDAAYSKNVAPLIEYMKNHFSKVYLTASKTFELAELVDKRAGSVLSDFEEYELRPFGHRLRHRLIKKWFLCGDVETKQELDEKVHQTEEILNAVLGRNLIPSRPLYLLILLQSCNQHQEGELQNSSFAYYYQYLITKSLQEAGVPREHMHELYNYLANLAWLFRNEKVKEIEESHLRQFNKVFSEKFIDVDFDKRISLLCRSRLMSKYGSYYSFNYPYIYFFFLGKYLADHLDDEAIRQWVGDACYKVNRRENADSILFLIHHRNDSWVISKIAETLSACFSGRAPLKLENDIDVINSLADSVSRLMLDEPDVEANQESSRKYIDELHEAESEHDDVSEEVEEFGRLALLMKTAELLGQVLKNYYGSIERAEKQRLIKAVFEGPLRMQNEIYRMALDEPDRVLGEIEKKLREHGKITNEKEASQLARKFIFQLFGLLSAGIIAATARFVSTEKLKADIADVVQSNGTVSFKLIKAATSLTQPGRLPLESIRALAKELEPNKFAYALLQTLVVYHLQMFHVKESDRQKLCTYLNINIGATKTLQYAAAIEAGKQD